MSTRWVVITGTSTGIGRAAALRLAGMGYGVLAGVRRPADGEALVKTSDSALSGRTQGCIFPLILDVAREDSIAAAVEQVRSTVGQDGLWALVNNAGIVVPGPVEHLTPADWRRQFDVNFFGIVELTRLSLPLLRQGVIAHGLNVPRLMLVSSIGGRIAQPINAPYTCSKWATTCLGDSLRLELRRQGIGVTVLEPGAIATAIWAKGEVSGNEFGPSHPARTHYGPEIDGLTKLAAKTAAAAISAEKAADLLVRALQAHRAPARVLIGNDAKLAAFFRTWLPLSWFDTVLLSEYGVARLSASAPAMALSAR